MRPRAPNSGSSPLIRSIPTASFVRLSDHVDVVFLLIPVEPGHAGPAQSFYIMENKVWNELFDAYLKDKPEAARKLKDFDRRRAAWEREGGSWPLFNITSREAQEFAHWLVPSGALKLSGDLPTSEQWDKAAGFYDRENSDPKHDDRGPFLRGWSPNDKEQIAIRREKEGPLPVGTATKDISRFGCRDMAGNGWEWTRPDEKLPIAADLRGRKFSDSQPFLFNDPHNDTAVADKHYRGVGFRVVIEGL